MAIGVLGGVAGFAFIWFSPIRAMHDIPAEFPLQASPEDAPITE
jgi:hypothetical protein